jgi:hypothetical protein
MIINLQPTGAFTKAGQDIVTSTSNSYSTAVNGRRRVLIRSRHVATRLVPRPGARSSGKFR